MPVKEVYPSLEDQLAEALIVDDKSASRITKPFLKRVALIVQGIIRAKEVTPARIAKALAAIGLSHGNPESIERTIRRIENDARLDQSICLHPLARRHLAVAHTKELTLIVDPTYLKDRIVVVTIAVWYRGQALPLAWALWEANVPLEGDRFWERIRQLLDEVKSLMPSDTCIVVLADRAFGTPAFTDMVERLGWYFVVRVQGQTRYRDKAGRERSLSKLLGPWKFRAKGHGKVFKSRGWRDLSIVVHWGKRHKSPLCLVSNLAAAWDLLEYYRHRYGIEALFRHMKSHGWHWEDSQVKDLKHWERLLTAMTLASWLALCAGTRMAIYNLIEQGKVKRKTLGWWAKNSLFEMGLIVLDELLCGGHSKRLGDGPKSWQLDWRPITWHKEITQHDLHARIFA